MAEKEEKRGRQKWAESLVTVAERGARMLRQDGLEGPGPAGWGASRARPAPSAPRQRGPVTKLPNYRRIPELLTGEQAANQRAAPLFSGRRPGDTRTFPHPGSR